MQFDLTVILPVANQPSRTMQSVQNASDHRDRRMPEVVERPRVARPRRSNTEVQQQGYRRSWCS